MKKLRFHPGETLVLNFVIPFSVYDVKAVSISFRGRDSLAFESTAIGFKSLDYEDETGRTVFRTRIGFTMNQAESLQFEEYANYKMQLNVFGPNGSRITSKEVDVETLGQQIPDPGYSIENSFYGAGMTKETGNGSMDYNKLKNKPQVNEVELVGNRKLPENPITENEISRIMLD